MVRETRHLWVGNLPENIREERILEHFKRYGRVQSVKLLPKKDEEASICATVAFIDIKSASKAQCSENKIDERTLKTDYYEPSTTSTAAIHIHERDDTLLRAGGIYNAVRNQRYPHGLSEDRGYERSSHYYERTQDRETYLRRPMSYHEEEVYQGRGRPRERNNSANYRGVVTTGFQNPLERIQPGHYRSHNSRQHFDSQQPQTPQQTQQRYAVEQYNMEERENSTGRGSRRSSPSRAKSRPGRQRQKSTSRSQSHSGSDCHSRSGSQSSCASRSSSSSSNTRSSSSSGSSQSGSHSGSRSQSRSQSPSVSYSSRGSSKANRTAEKTAVLSPAPLLQSTVSTPIPPSSQPSNVNLLTSVTMASESTTNTPTEKEDKRPLGICVRNLPVRSSDTSLKDGLFHEYKKHGKVTTVKVIGQGTERYAVVCFKKPEDVEKALEVSKDKLFFGSKIEVTSHEGLDVEDNEFRPLEAELDEYHPKATRTLFIGNLEKDITTAELRKHFEQFGEIIEIDIKKQGAVSSYAFVQYSDIASVVKAMRKMDGEHLGANRIKLGFGKSMSTNCVWLDGIADPVTEKFLTRQFVRFGPVGSTYIDREKGHALIFYERVEYAQIAVPEMRGRALGGKKLQIDFASRECQVAFFEKMEMSGQLLPGDRPWDRREQNFDTREERYNRDPRLVYENAGRAFGRFETQQRGRAHFRGSQRGNFNSRGRGQGFPNRSYDEEFSQTTGSNYDDSYEQELREYGFSQRERRDYGGDEHSRSFSPRRRRDELSLSPKERHSDGTSPHSRTDRNSSRYDSGREEEGEEKRSKFCEVDKERLIKKNRHRSISDQDSYHSQSPPNSRHESRSISPPAKEKRHKDRPPNRPRSPGTPFDSPDNDAVTFVDRENAAEYKDTGKRKLLENRLEYREPSQTDVTMINDFDVASRLRTKTDTERSKFRKVHNEGDGLNERRDCSLETPSTLKDFGNLFCTSDLTKLANIAGLNPRFLKPNAETERIQFDLDLNDKISNEGKLLESTDIIEEFSEKPVTDSGKDLTHLQKKKVHILHLLEQLEETGSSGDDSNVDTEGRPAKKTKLNDARHYVCNIGRQNAKEIKTSPPSAISKLIDSDGENFECRKSEGNNVAVQQQKILDLKNKGHVDMMDTCGVSEVLEDICFGFSNSPKSTSNNFLHKRRKSSSFSEDINCGKHLVHPISTSEESFDFSAVDIDLSSSENQSSKTDVRLMTAKSPDSKPGTPLVDEPRREKESPLSLPLPRFALNNTSVHSPRHSPMPVMSPKSSILKSPLMSPTGGCNINNLSTVSRELVCSDVLTCKNSPSVISLNTSEKSSSNVIDVKHKYSTCFSTTGSVVNNSKNNSLDSSSDSEHSPRLSPNCPSLDERIRILDEKYNAWSGSTRNIGHTITTSSDSLIKLDYEKFIKKRPSFLSTDITQLRTEPSDIVKSLLAKNSIFDQDSKRLEHINEKYEPREVTLDPSPKKTFCFRTKAAAKEFSPAISSPLPRHTVNSILSTSIMRYPYASSTTVTTSSQPVTQTAVTTTVTITHASQSSNVTSSASLTSPISSYPSMSFSPVTLTTTSHSPNSTRTDVSHKPASAVSTRKSSLESPKTPILRRESTLGITTVAPSPVRVPVNVTSSLTSPVTVTTSSTNILTVAAKRETPSGLTNRKEQNMVLKKDSKDPCTKRDVSCNNSFANFKDASRKETSSVGNISKEKTCVLRDTKKDPFLVVNNNKDCLMKKDIVPCNNNNREMYVKRETVQNNATKENQIRKENGVHNIPNKEMTRKDTTQVNNKRRLVSSDSNESESSRMSTKGEMKSEKDSKLKLDVKSQEPETKKPKVSSSNEDKKKNDKLERKASKSDSKYEKKEEKDKKCELKNIVDEKDKTKLESSTKVKEEKKCKSQKDVKDNAKSDSHSKRKNSTDSKNKEKKKDKKKDKKDKEKSDREKCKDKKTEKCKSDSSKHDKKAERCFNYLDEEPVYFSMYDKVKARSSQNEKAKEKEKELESMREKFSQLKKSRAKREEKIKNSSVEYDSDKASDAGSMPSSEASESKFSTKNKHILKKRKFFIPSDSEDDSDCKERKKSVQKSEDVKSDELSETEMPKESKNEKAKFKLKNDKSCLKSGCESSDVEAPVRPKECSNRKHKGKSKKKHDKEKSKPRKKSDDDSSDAEGSARTKWHNLKTDKMKKLKPHVTKVSEDESADSENLKGGEKVKFSKEEKQESSSPEGEQKVRKVSVKKENKKKKEKQKETFADVETSDEEQQEKIKLNRRKRSRKTSKNRDKKIQEKQTFMETTPVVKKEEDPVEIEMKVEEEPAPPMEEIKMEGCFDKYNSSHILAFSEDSLSNIAVLEKPLNFGLESEKSDSEHNITGPTISESNMPKLSLKEEDEEERLEMFSDSKETLEIFDKFLNNDLSSEESKVTKPLWLDDNLEEQNISLSDKNGIGELESNKCDMRINSEMSCTDFKPELPDLSTYDLDLNMPSLLDPPVKDERKPKKSRKSYKDKRRRSNRDDGAPKLDDVFHLIESNNEPTITSISFSEAEEMATTENTEDCKSLLPDSAELVEAVRVLESQLQESMIQSQNIIKPEEPLPEAPSPVPNETIEDMDDDKDFGMSSFAKLIVDESKMEENEKSDQEKENSEQKQGPLDIFEFTDDDDMEIPSKYAREENKRYRTQEEDSYEAKNRKAKVKKKKKNGKEDLSRKDDPKVFQEESKIIEEEAVKSPEKTMDLPELKAEPAFDKPLLHDVIPDLIAATENIPPADMHPVLEEKEPELETEQDPEDKGTSAISQEETEDAVKALLQATFGTDTYDSQDAQFSEEIVPKLEPILDELSKEESVDELPTEMTIDDQDISLTHEKEEEMPENRNEVPEEVTSEFTEDTVKECVEEKTENCLSLFVEEKNDTSVLQEEEEFHSSIEEIPERPKSADIDFQAVNIPEMPAVSVTEEVEKPEETCVDVKDEQNDVPVCEEKPLISTPSESAPMEIPSSPEQLIPVSSPLPPAPIPETVPEVTEPEEPIKTNENVSTFQELEVVPPPPTNFEMPILDVEEKPSVENSVPVETRGRRGRRGKGRKHSEPISKPEMSVIDEVFPVSPSVNKQSNKRGRRNARSEFEIGSPDLKDGLDMPRLEETLCSESKVAAENDQNITPYEDNLKTAVNSGDTPTDDSKEEMPPLLEASVAEAIECFNIMLKDDRPTPETAPAEKIVETPKIEETKNKRRGRKKKFETTVTLPSPPTLEKMEVKFEDIEETKVKENRFEVRHHAQEQKSITESKGSDYDVFEFRDDDEDDAVTSFESSKEKKEEVKFGETKFIPDERKLTFHESERKDEEKSETIIKDDRDVIVERSRPRLILTIKSPHKDSLEKVAKVETREEPTVRIVEHRVDDHRNESTFATPHFLCLHSELMEQSEKSMPSQSSGKSATRKSQRLQEKSYRTTIDEVIEDVVKGHFSNIDNYEPPAILRTTRRTRRGLTRIDDSLSSHVDKQEILGIPSVQQSTENRMEQPEPSSEITTSESDHANVTAIEASKPANPETSEIPRTVSLRTFRITRTQTRAENVKSDIIGSVLQENTSTSINDAKDSDNSKDILSKTNASTLLETPGSVHSTVTIHDVKLQDTKGISENLMDTKVEVKAERDRINNSSTMDKPPSLQTQLVMKVELPKVSQNFPANKIDPSRDRTASSDDKDVDCSPTALVDPVTGFLTPVRQSEEGTYVPATVNSSGITTSANTVNEDTVSVSTCIKTAQSQPVTAAHAPVVISAKSHTIVSSSAPMLPPPISTTEAIKSPQPIISLATPSKSPHPQLVPSPQSYNTAIKEEQEHLTSRSRSQSLPRVTYVGEPPVDVSARSRSQSLSGTPSTENDTRILHPAMIARPSTQIGQPMAGLPSHSWSYAPAVSNPSSVSLKTSQIPTAKSPSIANMSNPNPVIGMPPVATGSSIVKSASSKANVQPTVRTNEMSAVVMRSVPSEIAVVYKSEPGLPPSSCSGKATISRSTVDLVSQSATVGSETCHQSRRESAQSRISNIKSQTPTTLSSSMSSSSSKSPVQSRQNPVILQQQAAYPLPAYEAALHATHPYGPTSAGGGVIADLLQNSNYILQPHKDYLTSHHTSNQLMDRVSSQLVRPSTPVAVHPEVAARLGNPTPPHTPTPPNHPSITAQADMMHLRHPSQPLVVHPHHSHVGVRHSSDLPAAFMHQQLVYAHPHYATVLHPDLRAQQAAALQGMQARMPFSMGSGSAVRISSECRSASDITKTDTKELRTDIKNVTVKEEKPERTRDEKTSVVESGRGSGESSSTSRNSALSAVNQLPVRQPQAQYPSGLPSLRQVTPHLALSPHDRTTDSPIVANLYTQGQNPRISYSRSDQSKSSDPRALEGEVVHPRQLSQPSTVYVDPRSQTSVALPTLAKQEIQRTISQQSQQQQRQQQQQQQQQQQPQQQQPQPQQSHSRSPAASIRPPSPPPAHSRNFSSSYVHSGCEVPPTPQPGSEAPLHPTPHILSQPVVQPRTQLQTPPHASQVPPQGDSLLMLLQRYPVMWQGLLALKNDQAAVQMHFVSGNHHVAISSLPSMSEGGTPPLRIAQRMRLEQTQLEGVARRMQMEGEHCMLLALPCGRDHMDVLQQSNNLRNGFITYLQQKQAAGIVNVAAPGSQQPAYVVHIFPSCEFSNENLARIAPDLLHSVTDIAHLLIVIATV